MVLSTISALEVTVEELLVDTPIPVSALSLKHTSRFCLVSRDIYLREFFSFRYTNCMVFVLIKWNTELAAIKKHLFRERVNSRVT